MKPPSSPAKEGSLDITHCKYLMVQIRNQGPEKLAGILKFIETRIGLGETRGKIPNFFQVFFQLSLDRSNYEM